MSGGAGSTPRPGGGAHAPAPPPAAGEGRTADATGNVLPSSLKCCNNAELEFTEAVLQISQLRPKVCITRPSGSKWKLRSPLF